MGNKPTTSPNDALSSLLDKIDSKANVGQKRMEEVEIHLKEMKDWRKEVIELNNNKGISELISISFSFKDYSEVVFAIVGKIEYIDYKEEFENEEEKLVFNTRINSQRVDTLKEMNQTIDNLHSARSFFKENSEHILQMLDKTINNGEEIVASMKLKHRVKSSQIDQNDHDFTELKTLHSNFINASEILIKTYNSIISVSFDNIAYLYAIRIFKNSQTQLPELKKFHRIEEIRHLLLSKDLTSKGGSLNKYKAMLAQLKQESQNIKLNESELIKDTNFLLYQVLHTRYVENISKYIISLSEAITKYEKLCGEQVRILEKINNMIGHINYSKGIFEVFNSFKKIEDEYQIHLISLDGKYHIARNIKKIKEIIEDIRIFYKLIKTNLISDIKEQYKKPGSPLLPITTAKEAIDGAYINMGLIKNIVYLVLKFLNKQVFDENIVVTVINSCDKNISINEKSHKEIINRIMSTRDIEFKNNYFYNELLKILDMAISIYIKKINTYIEYFPVNEKGIKATNVKELVKEITSDIKDLG